MPDEKELKEESKVSKTPQEVMEEISYIIYPEKELDQKTEADKKSAQNRGAYDYLKQQYGNRDDWNQFEELYREQLEIANTSYSYVGEEILREKQELLNLRMKLEGVEGEINLRDIPEVVEATRREEQRFMERQNAGVAAVFAFDKYADSCLAGMNTDDVRKAAVTEQKRSEQDTQNNALTARLLENAAENKLEYVVRGAPIMCSCGSHSRHLDMLKSHGIYVNGRAVAFEEDCESGINIPYFGHCQSSSSDLTEMISLKMQRNVNAEGVSLTEYDGSIYVGVKCVPEFNGHWDNTHETTVIAESSGQEVSENECKRVVTTASFLTCRQGGIIYPLTSGQYDESYYQAPFQNYPYEDVGSDVFLNWCKEKGICPYMPGTPDYYDWNREKIDGLKQKGAELQEQSKKWIEDAATGSAGVNTYAGDYELADISYTQLTANYEYINPYDSQIAANNKELKKVYETFLYQAYEKGLDTMPDEEEDKIRETLEEYTESGLLSEKEKEEVIDRYSGLRLKYGDNGKRQEQGYSWQDQALYDETLSSLQQLEERAERTRKTPDMSYNEYASRGETNTVNKKADELYNAFMTEVAAYGPGYDDLTMEQKRTAEKIYDTYSRIKKEENSLPLKEVMNNF